MADSLKVPTDEEERRMREAAEASRKRRQESAKRKRDQELAKKAADNSRKIREDQKNKDMKSNCDWDAWNAYELCAMLGLLLIQASKVTIVRKQLLLLLLIMHREPEAPSTS